MERYTTFDPNAELNGRTVLGFIRNVNHEDIESILIRHHLNKIDPEKWYNLQALLDVLTDISNDFNSTENLVAVGIAAGELGIMYLPPELKNFTREQLFESYDRLLYATRHRGNAGNITFVKESPTHFKMITHIPYPDDIFYGVFYAYLRHFNQPGGHFILRYDDTAPRHDHGGPTTIYHIEIS